MKSNPLKKWIHLYASKRWYVFPIKHRGKEPLTQHGYKDATTNEEQILNWLKTYPQMNIGIACGASNLVVIDIDEDRGGMETWRELREKHQINDETVTALTPSGGQHLYYATDEPIPCSANRLGKGIDVKGNGGYVVVPPSIHPNGKEYLWEIDLSPQDLDPIPLPASLRNLLIPQDRPASQDRPKDNFPKPKASILLDRCEFIKYCKGNAKTLTEPLWYAMITNLASLDGGEELIHDLSKPYPKYTQKETQEKIAHALRDAPAPHTCKFIRENGFNCTKSCPVKAPAGLAYNQEKERVFSLDNRYHAWKKVGQSYSPAPISNFTIEVKRSISTPDEVIRQVCFTGADGTKSKLVDMHANSMVSIQKFKEFCLAQGNYFFDGDGEELRALLELELSKSSELIYQPDRIGYIGDGTWLFGNIAIREGQGDHIYPNSESVFRVGEKGYIPLQFEEGTPLPVVSIREDMEDYTNEVLNAINLNLGFNGWLALGWCASHVYLPEIVEGFKCFPELFLYGKLKVGKNTLARWLMSFFGLETPEKTISETSQTWISRAISYFSCLPVWLDEYRNEKKIKEKNGVLRNIFDRVGSGKGHLGFGGISYPARSSLILSGQVLPDDSALLSRCCVIRLSRQTRNDKFFSDVDELSKDFSAILVHLIKQKNERSKEHVIESINQHRSRLKEQGVDDREAIIYAVPIAGVELLHRDLTRLKPFIDWIIKESKQSRQSKEEESELSIFWDDVSVLLSNHKITTDHFKVDEGGDYLYLWFPAIYNIWSEDYRRRTGENPFSKSSIIDLLSEEEYFVERDKAIRFGDKVKKCVALQLSKLPQFIREAFENF